LLEQLDNVDLRDTIHLIQDDIVDNQLSAIALRKDVDKINGQLSSTLRYKGRVVINDSISTFADVFYKFYTDTDKNLSPNDISATALYPGEFLIVDASKNNYKIENVKVGHNDRIYIKGKDPIDVSAITSANVDVEDVYDSDTVHEWQLNDAITSFASCSADISNALCEASCILSADDKYLSS